MAVPPVRGQPYTFCLGLASQANNGLFQDSPTIAPGDVVVVRDTTVLGNITTLPSALVGCTRLVQVTVSADEMDGGQTLVLFHDAAGEEWKDVLAIIDTAAQTFDTMDSNIDSILALIAALNDLSSAEAQAAAAAAIVAAGVATGAEVAALNDLSAAEVNAEVVDALATDVIADSIPAAGSRPTIAQALYMLVQYMNERSVSATTVTVKKEDGSTSLYTLTLDDATNPTEITRAT